MRSGGPRALRRVIVGSLVGTGVFVGLSQTAGAATTATFANGVLTVVGDGSANTIDISRDASGAIVVNGGAVAISGGTPTVANTVLVVIAGNDGDDVISLDEANGALPPANLSGGADQDTLTGGSGADQLFGQGGHDTLAGLAGADSLFGGTENDTLSGGDGNDQVFGERHHDRMLWKAGDDIDSNEGGPGVDSVEVYGSVNADMFTTVANGGRVQIGGSAPAPFAIDIGTSEDLYVIAGRGDDSFMATGIPAGLIKFTVDGGPDRDTLLGSDGDDLLIGGDGEDVVDGQRGDDAAFLGGRNDTFTWDPGDGNDIVDGDVGADTLVFNGSTANEIFEASAVGDRLRLTRNLANVVVDTNGIETIDLHALGGNDTLTVHDATGTDLVDLNADLAGVSGSDDFGFDSVVVQATGDDDTVVVTGEGTEAEVTGLQASISVSSAHVGDRLAVHGLAGDDMIDASGVGGIELTLVGGDDDDVLIGGSQDDDLFGGDGDDVLIGGPGVDTLDGGADEDTVIQLTGDGNDQTTSAAAAGNDWLTTRVQIVDGKTVLHVGGQQRTVPRADLSTLR